MASLNSSPPSRAFRIHLLLMVLLILSQEAHSICPSGCRCRSQYASCGYQNLSAIPVGLPGDIRTFYLEYNQFTKLAAGEFSSFIHLEKLYLYNNHIRVIEDGAFRGLASLTLLSLESNNISILTNRTFEGVPNLEELYLRNNRLSSLTSGAFSQVPRLLKLNLAKNEIGEFPADVSRDLGNIENLDISNNPASLLSTPIFGQMSALQHLMLNDLSVVNNATVEDSITDLAFDGLSNLRNLELNGNRLTKIPSEVKTLPNLTSLSLYLNSIQSVNADDFHQPSLLESLDLEYNSLAEIRTSALTEFSYLIDLYLNYNPISSIRSQTFFLNSRLSTLYVAYTNLTSIDKDAFVGLTRLDTLFLKGNNLTTIVDGTMNHVNPNVNLELSGNPIRCDCYLRGFAAWLKNKHTGLLNGGTLLKCVTPDRLKDTSVTDLLPNQFACEPRLSSTSPIAPISALLGMDVILPCLIDADPISHINWITNTHKAISPDQSHQPHFAMAVNGSLLITNVSLSDEGLYTCEVSNVAGEARHSVTLQITSSPTVGFTTKLLLTTTAATNGTLTATFQESGLVIGIAVVILVIVLTLIVSAALVVRRRNRKSRPSVQSIPLPPLPLIVIGRQTNDVVNPCRSSTDEVTYDEIPADRITCDANGYSTRITAESGAEQSPTEVDNTYFSRIRDCTDSKCEQGLEGDEALTVKSPVNRYSALPSSSAADDRYMTMKPQTE